MAFYGYDFSATRQYLKQIVESGSTAGMSLQVTRRGETILAVQAGYADIAEKKPITPDTIFRIFSMTKPITAVLFLTLYEKGLVHLSDPVSLYLPGFRHPLVWFKDGDGWKTRPAEREITLHHLLTMTSGIPYQFDNHPASQEISKLFGTLYKEAEKGKQLSLPDVANQLGQIPLCFDPGSQWLYGLSIDVIGAVIEVITGKSLGRYMKETLLEPLSMRDTDFYLLPSQANRLAVLYAEEQGHLTPSQGQDLVPGSPTEPPLIEFGGAGLYSTRADYTRFARMLLGGGILEDQRIISRRSIHLMRQNHLTPDQLKTCNWDTLRGYGYGLSVRTLMDPALAGSLASSGEFGWDGAAGTWFSVNPADEMTIVYMTQRLPADHIRFIPKLQATIYSAMSF